MTDDIRLALMEQALARYDASGDGSRTAACHLQAAIDAERENRPMRPDEDFEPGLLKRLLP